MTAAILNKLESYFPWMQGKHSPLSLFYTAAIQALKQTENHRSALNSLLSVQNLTSTSSFSIQKYSPLFPTFAQKQLNKCTWELFKGAVIAEVGETKFKAICERYAKFLPCKLLESGAPFYLKYIKIFHLGLSQITAEDVSFKTISPLSEKELTKKIQKLYERRCGSLKSLLETTPLYASSYTHLFQDQGKALGVLLSQAREQKCIPASSLKNLPKNTSSLLHSKFIPWLEVFSKRIVNREFVQGQLIPVPEDKKGGVQWYKVYAKIASCGLVAYALQPATLDSKLPPLLVFRPTQTHAGAEDFLETLRNDLDSAVGKSGWLATESAFKKLMQDPVWRAKSEKIVVAGFSLGGAHMQYFLSQYVNDVMAAYSFNSPGVDEETAREFKDKIKHPSSWRWKSPFQLFIFRSEKDLVPLVGKVHVGLDIRNKKGAEIHVIEGVFNEKVQGFAQAHRRALLSDPECHLYEISDPFGFHQELHNGDRPHWLHRVHDKSGWILSRLLYLVMLITNAIERLTGTLLLRQPLQYHWIDS